MPNDLETPLDDEADDSSVIRDLRQKANRTDAAEAKTAELERKLVVHEAGLTGLTEKQHKALAAAHEGDWEPEALKATATELGFGITQPLGDEPKVPAEELAAHQRVATAANGETPAPPTDLDAALAAAKSPEEIKVLLGNAGMLPVE